MKTAETKTKKFSTVEQIFKSYIPNYSPQRDHKYSLDGKAGVQLAKNLLIKLKGSISATKKKNN